MPARTSTSCPRVMTRSTRPGSIFLIASIRPICVVTWITRSFGDTSIIDTSGVPVRCASSSVWPGIFVAGRMQRFLGERRGADALRDPACTTSTAFSM